MWPDGALALRPSLGELRPPVYLLSARTLRQGLYNKADSKLFMMALRIFVYVSGAYLV